MIKGPLSRQMPTAPRTDVPASPTAGAAAPASREAASRMQGDALVSRGAEATLDNRNLFARVPSRNLIDVLRQGSLPPDGTEYHLDTFIDGSSRKTVMQLSDEGRKALLDQTPGLAEDLIAGKKADEIAAKTPIQLGTHVQEILVSPQDRESALKAYGELVSKGEAPETIGGKPYQAFFDQHVRATEDLSTELELKNFRKQVPGFADLSPLEQRSRAALGGRMAESWSPAIPGDLRRQMANTMIRHKTFNRPEPGAGVGTVGEIKDFFHGTTMGGMISRVGFRGQPEMLYNELPKSVQGVLKRQLNVNFASVLGPGVYYGNAGVASNYAILKLGSKKSVQIVSGHVALGKTTTKEFVDEDTRISPVASPEGAYYVTKDPRRFAIKGLTTLDPKQTDGLMRYFPQILKAHAQDPISIGYLVARLPEGPSRRALEEAVKDGNPTTRRSATLLLARRGDEAHVTTALKMLEETPQDPAVGEALFGAVRKMGAGHSEQTIPILEAILKNHNTAGQDPSFFPMMMVDTVGDDAKPLLAKYGLNAEGALGPKQGLKDRVRNLASKGLKHLF